MTSSTEWRRRSDSGVITPPGDTVRKGNGRRTLGRAGMSIGHLGGPSCSSLLILSLSSPVYACASPWRSAPRESTSKVGRGIRPRLRGPHSVADLAVAGWGTPSPAIPDGD